MNINVFRIDDRLIHGQIITKWLNFAEADKIILVDDLVANDKIQQSILKFAVPSNIKINFYTKKEAIDVINKDKSNDNILLIMRNPKEASEFFDMGFKTNKINLGNISNSKSETGRTKILDYIYVEEDDVKALNKLKDKGIDVIVKAVPSEKGKNIFDLLNKKYK